MLILQSNWTNVPNLSCIATNCVIAGEFTGMTNINNGLLQPFLPVAICPINFDVRLNVTSEILQDKNSSLLSRSEWKMLSNSVA